MYGSLLDALESGTTLVTANNRFARTLRHAYEDRQCSAGAVVWRTPDVLSWSAWLRRLWTEARLQGLIPAENLLLGDTSAAELWQLCISADADFTSESVWRSPGSHQARLARQSWQTLNEWEALAASEWAQPDLSPDQQAWLRWAGRYRDRCTRAGWTDSDSLPGLLAKTAGLVAVIKTPLLFAGFDEWSPAKLRLRTVLAEAGCSITLTDRDSCAPQPVGRPCADQFAEIRQAAAWAHGQLQTNPVAAVGVVVPDLASRAAAIERCFLDVLAPGWRVTGIPPDLPLNLSYGPPLASSPMIHSALAILAATRGRMAFDELSLLVRSAWLRGSAHEAAARARLELELRSQLRAQIAPREVLALCAKDTPELAAVLTALINFDSHWRCRASVWVSKIVGLLGETGWPGRQKLDSHAWQTLRAWHELLAEFGASDAVLGELDWGAALAIVRRLAQQQVFQTEGAARGIQVMGVLEAAGHRFDHLWVCGMAREQWPPSSRPDPFIPLNLQRRLHMPRSSPAEMLERAARLTARLLEAAPSIVVSWPVSVEGEMQQPSPLLGLLPVQDESPPLPELWNELQFNAACMEHCTDDHPPAWPANERVRGGVRVLNLQAVSPLNAFIEKRLGAFSMDEPATGISPRLRGTLTHFVLEQLYRQAASKQRIQAMGPDERMTAIRRLLQERVEGMPGFDNAYMRQLVAIEIEQQTSRIERFVRIDLERPEFDDVRTEEQFDVQLGALRLRVKLDRSDRLADGSRVIIDYKTGGADRRSWNPARPGDLQLPLYATTVFPDAAAICFARLSPQGVGYDGVGEVGTGINGVRVPGRRNNVEVKYLQPDTDQVIESWDELKAAWQRLLLDLAAQFTAGDFRLDPLNPDSGRGQFAVLSRIYDTDVPPLEAEA